MNLCLDSIGTLSWGGGASLLHPYTGACFSFSIFSQLKSYQVCHAEYIEVGTGAVLRVDLRVSPNVQIFKSHFEYGTLMTHL